MDGWADQFTELGIAVVGPNQALAQLEGSKAFAKAFMERNGIPTAQYRSFTAAQQSEALAYLATVRYPHVVKASGLAAGKGVVIAQTEAEAAEAVRHMLSGEAFGEAGSEIVLEEFLQGEELSIFVLTDGTTYRILPTARDHKRIGEGDTGPNTGGMGAIAPAPAADPEFLQQVERQVILPTLHGLRQISPKPYQGFIFIGLMRVGNIPYVLEYNVRMGDPETQAVFPLIESDVAELLLATATGRLGSSPIRIKPEAACTVVLASSGYPGSYETGKRITGLPPESEDLLVFQAGVRLSDTNELLTAGGRVLAVTALAPTSAEARAKALHAADNISFENKYFRRDIGA
jgi:phosphoribosylamine--glycine ligase